MVYCVQAYLIFATAATRDSRVTQATTTVGSKNRWDVTRIEKTEDPDPNSAYVEARFTSKNDQQTIKTQLGSMLGLQSGSWIQLHDCPHDEARGACVVESRQEF